MNDALPNKVYLVNVLNTVIPDLIMDTIKLIRQKKVTVEEEESPIIVSAEYYNAIQTFTTIATNQRVCGIHRLIHQEEIACMICKETINRGTKKFFACRRHVGHRGCVNQYA